MCVATVAAVSASAETASQNDFSINRPYSSMPFFDAGTISLKSNKYKFASAQLNDLSGKDITCFDISNTLSCLSPEQKAQFGELVAGPMILAAGIQTVKSMY